MGIPLRDLPVLKRNKRKTGIIAKVVADFNQRKKLEELIRLMGVARSIRGTRLRSIALTVFAIQFIKWDIIE